MNVLFVCTGNSCRSVMAHQLLKKMLEDRGIAGWEAASAGLAAQPYFPVPGEVRETLAGRGVPPFSHIPTPLRREHVKRADLVLAMEDRHIRALREEFPEFADKIHLLREKAGFDDREIPDPIGRDREFYERTMDLIEEATERILHELHDRKDANA